MDKEFIFISYSRKDEQFAKQIAIALKKENFKIWFDQFDIPKGALWDNEIEKALKNCHTVLFVISKNSVASNNVLDEISYALEENKQIIPLKINVCEIPFRIRRKQYIDFVGNYENGIQSLISTLNKVEPTPIEVHKKPNYFKLKIIAASVFITAISVLLFYKFFPNTFPPDIPTVIQLPSDTLNNNQSISNETTKVDTNSKLLPKVSKDSSQYIEPLKMQDKQSTTVVSHEVATNKVNNNNQETKSINWTDNFTNIVELNNSLLKVCKVTLIEKEGKKYSVYKYGVIDKNGNRIIECDYDDILAAKNSDYFFVKRKENWGVCDKYGGLIIDIAFYEISGPSEGFFKFQHYTLGSGFMNLNGSILASGFGECRNFKEGMAAVSSRNTGQWGFINNKGELAIGYYYEKVDDFTNEGVAHVFYTPKYETKQTARWVKKNGDYSW